MTFKEWVINWAIKRAHFKIPMSIVHKIKDKMN